MNQTFVFYVTYLFLNEMEIYSTYAAHILLFDCVVIELLQVYYFVSNSYTLQI